MQQAYQALRVISEAQTVRVVLAARPGELALTELSSFCEALRDSSGAGIKAVVLDFAAEESETTRSLASELLERTSQAVRAIPQPVLAVVRTSPSDVASRLIAEADFTLVAHEANLQRPGLETDGILEVRDNRIGGLAAIRLGYATWSASSSELKREMERILNMLRTKSAIALRHAKNSVRLAQEHPAEPLEALRQVNAFYLDQVMSTEDAHEGLQAFLEKRQPRWKNR